MKKLRFNTSVGGLNFGYKVYTDFQPFEYELEDQLAEGYIARGIAYEVIDEAAEEAKKEIKRARKSSRRKHRTTDSAK